MKTQRHEITMVNHADMDIAVPPDMVWREIVELFVDARGWREKGYAITTLDDPSAIYGGYRMSLEQDGETIDDRICIVTERDDTMRRLSLFADYLSAPGGMLVYVTYRALGTAEGTRFCLDCHSRLSVATETGARDAVTAAAEEAKGASDAYLADYLGRTRAKLEAAFRISAPAR